MKIGPIYLMQVKKLQSYVKFTVVRFPIVLAASSDTLAQLSFDISYL